MKITIRYCNSCLGEGLLRLAVGEYISSGNIWDACGKHYAEVKRFAEEYPDEFIIREKYKYPGDINLADYM